MRTFFVTLSRPSRAVWFLLPALVLAACSDPVSGVDPETSVQEDATDESAPTPDVALKDRVPPAQDTGANDAATTDTGATDATVGTDAQGADVAPTDASVTTDRSPPADMTAPFDAVPPTDGPAPTDVVVAQDTAPPRDGPTTPDASVLDAPPPLDVAIDRPTLTDAPVDRGVTPDAPADASVCSFVGDYSLMSPIGTLYFRLAADGTWYGANSREALDSGMAINAGTWRASGGQVTVTEGSSGATGCMAGAVGTYNVAFAAGCGSMVWTAVTDACVVRSAAISGQTFARLGASMADAGVVTDAATDGGRPDVGVDGGTACTLVSDWQQGSPLGTIFYRFALMGTWEGAMTQSALGTIGSTRLGNYTFDGTTLRLTNDLSGSCSAMDVGVYTVSFGMSCASATLALVSDTCVGRRTVLPSAALQRR